MTTTTATKTKKSPATTKTPTLNSRASIQRWMMANKENYRDRRTGELNCTELVEAWDLACADGGATLDPDHIAWDVAVSLES